MILADLSPKRQAALLRGPGLGLRTGPFSLRIRSRLPEVVDGIGMLYADNPAVEDISFADFTVAVATPRTLRRWYRPQVRFLYDGHSPFLPLPRAQALPLLEWGLNWSVSNHAHHFLIIHAATIARDDLAVILPAPPGSGKSTLCAGLVHRGWRLLSDELALLSLDDGAITPLVRPISLKNESIAVIRDYLDAPVLSPECRDTNKGTVALLKAPLESVRSVDRPASPAWVIFPQFEAGAPAALSPRSKANTCLEIGENAFNYSVHGARGFEVLTDLIDRCDCYDFRYGDLDDAVAAFAGLEPPPAVVERRAVP